MQAVRSSIGSANPMAETAIEAMPGPLPKPPGRPPAEPIVIRTPPRPPEDTEMDRSDEEEEDERGEIKRLPGWVPDMPPPSRPEDRAARPVGRRLLVGWDVMPSRRVQK